MYNYKQGSGVFKIIIFSVLSAIITFLGTYIYITEKEYKSYSNVEDNISTVSTQIDKNDIQKNEEEGNNFTNNIFDNSITSVVGISALKLNVESIINSGTGKNWNMGSGIIVTEDGYILTNQHVAGNKGDSVLVTLYNNKTYEGITKWSDSVIDLAIITIDASDLETARLGNSDDIQLGESAYAIGNPLGLDFQRTITSGIISALNRTIKINDENGFGYMENLIQTDASINPGNSGGPLINDKGEVIGINTIKVNDAEGIGFAIPINTAKSIIESFKNDNEFVEAYLGIFAYDNILLSYIEGGVDPQDGMLVANVDRLGPLANSKMEVDSILLRVDDKQMKNMSELRKYLYTKKPNDVVKITFTSNGKKYTENITLGIKK